MHRHGTALNKAGPLPSKRHGWHFGTGTVVKIPLLVAMLVVAMLGGLAFIFLVM